MKTSTPKTIVLALLSVACLAGCTANSQKPKAAKVSQLPRDPVIDAYVGVMRADLSNGKVKIINSVMNLSNDEAKTFWPIYQDYESELFELGDQRVELIRRFASAQNGGRLASNQATELADGFFKFEQQQLDLVKKYHGIIATELSPIRAAQFAQIEHRVGTIIDLTIAAEIPLIQAPSVASR